MRTIVSSAFHMKIPVQMQTHQHMVSAVGDVLSGEYECGLFGEDLSISDIGANVGAFAIWANSRWPNSRITAYEPHPGTYEMLERNAAPYPNISAVNAAIYPTQEDRISFSARYVGDGEAGVLPFSEATFRRVPENRRFEVRAIHPCEIVSADIVKLDVEGSEAAIIQHLDLSATSLILLEFQNDENRSAIKSLLGSDFNLLFEDEFPWDPLIGTEYNPRLSGDHYGHLFYVRKTGSKLSPALSQAPARRSSRSVVSAIRAKLLRPFLG